MGIPDFFSKLVKKLKPILAPFEFVGKMIALVVNTLLLTGAYFTAIAATAIIAKVFRKRFLELKPDKEKKSYWMEKKNEDYGKEESYKSF